MPEHGVLPGRGDDLTVGAVVTISPWGLWKAQGIVDETWLAQDVPPMVLYALWKQGVSVKVIEWEALYDG